MINVTIRAVLFRSEKKCSSFHINECPSGNSVIPVNGDESVDLENTHFTRKPPGRHSRTLKQFCKVHVVRHNLLYLYKYILYLFVQ